MPFFLYEVSIYEVGKNWTGIVDSKWFKSDKLLDIKKEVVYKKFKGREIVRYIDLLGAPMSFIQEHNLPIYELNPKKKTSKKKKS